MSASNRSEATPVKTNSSSVLIIPIYTAAIFLSAALLFAVQPMFTKMVLPRFGGSPSVWSVAMVFFQGILLLGYAYADILTRFVRGPLALLIHLAVMLGGAVFLPVAIAKGWGLPPSDREQLFLLGLFSVSIGFPFFALSANGPLLQAWFARSGLAQAENPFWLYLPTRSLLNHFRHSASKAAPGAPAITCLSRCSHYVEVWCSSAAKARPFCRGRSRQRPPRRLAAWVIGWRSPSCRQH